VKCAHINQRVVQTIVRSAAMEGEVALRGKPAVLVSLSEASPVLGSLLQDGPWCAR
jgi:hypothetical protein